MVTSKVAFFNAIVDERAWEFGGEMIRKYELIRWNLYAKKAQETEETLIQMANSAANGQGKYADLPDYMYWKLDASGNFTVLNPNRKYIGTPDASWTRQSFLASLGTSTPSGWTIQEWVVKDWVNYYKGPAAGVARYVFPIPSEAVLNSQGVLDNNGYNFTK